MPIRSQTAVNRSALDIAKKQFQAWTLSEENAARIRKLTEKKVAESWSREAGLAETRKTLGSLTEAEMRKPMVAKIGTVWTNGVSATTPISTWLQTKEEERRNKAFLDVSSWLTNEQRAALWEKIKGKTLEEANKIYESEWLIKKLGFTPKDTIDTWKIIDTGISDVDVDVSKDSVDILNKKVTDLKKQLQEEGLAASDYADIERQIKYYQSSIADKEYYEQQQERQTKIDDVTWEIRDIQSSERLKQAKIQLDNLKNNTAYLWNMWQPAQSAKQLDAITNQLNYADETYDRLVRVEALAKEARTLGDVGRAKQFERQMDLMQQDLDEKVEQSLQEALDKIDKAEIDGLIYDEDSMEQFRNTLLADTDKSIAELSERNWRRRQVILDYYDNILKNEQTKQANKSKFTVHPWGYYVDGNNDPVLWVDGQRIEIPKKLPDEYQPFMRDGVFYNVLLDEKGWVILDENGAPQWNSTQMINEPTFAEQTISWYADLIRQGKMDLDDINKIDPALLQNPAIISALGQAPWEELEAPKVQKITIDGEEVSVSWNPETEQWERISVWATIDDEWEIDYSAVDFSTNQEMIDKYVWEASFKNNNPTWMTMTDRSGKVVLSKNLQNLFKEAGINYEVWSQRPPNEWGNYVKFASVQDGLDAYTIALTQAWSNDVYSRLATWVGTTSTATNDQYARWLMEQAGIEKGTKFSELSEDQLGALMSAQLQKESPNYYNELANIPAPTQEVTPTDIMTFNSSTFKPQKDLKTKKDKAKYKQFLADKKAVMGNKDASMEDILAYSAWGKDLTDTSIKTLTKFDSALTQLWDIQEQIQNLETWPIIWRLKKMNPYLTDVRTLQASLTALLPNLARWVYGEVWVLTDNDIRLYSQTIPNLTDTQKTNEAILAMTLKVVAWGYKKQLQTLAAAGKDVSGFRWLYDSLMGQVEALEIWLLEAQEPEEWESVKDLADKYFWAWWTAPTTQAWATTEWTQQLNEKELYNKYYK